MERCMRLRELFAKVKGKGELSVGLTQEGLKEWVASLPLLDLPRCAVMLDAALFRLTMSEYRDQSWYDLLVILFEPIGTLSRLATKKCEGDVTTSKESQRALIFFIRKLHLQMGDHCYHMLVDGESVLNDTKKTQAAFYALQSYGLAILRSYQLSMLNPKQIWLKFYDTYHHLSNEPTDSLLTKLDNDDAIYDYLSPLSIFSSVVILSILSPYKLSTCSLEDIYMILNETIDNSIFYTDSSLQEGYCFSYSEDRAPFLCQFYSEDKSSVIFINQKLALTQLKAVVNQGFKISTVLLQGLAEIETRQYERFVSMGKAQIISGIVNSYRFLYAEVEGHYDNQDSMKNLFVYPDQKSKHWPIIINVYKKATLSSNAIDPSDKFMSWEIIDKSPQGVGLVSHESYPIDELAIGNFTQLTITSSGRFCSALVRWINIKEGGLISLGLKYLARENIPVYLQSKNQKKQGLKSLAILGKYTFKPWPSTLLITQGLSYRCGEEISLISGEHRIKIKLTECLVNNKKCKIFSFNAEDGQLDYSS